MNNLLLRGALILCFLLTSNALVAQTSAPTTLSPPNLSLAETTRLLAGFDTRATEGVAESAKRPSFVEHHKAMERAWKQFRALRLKTLAAFSARELSGHPASKGPVFYPFSGPDVVHALALFPQSAQFVLTGLEPVGEVPDLLALNEQQTALILADLRHSLGSLLGTGFFKTNDMRTAMRTERDVGVLPVLLVLLARYEATIGKIEFVRITPDARLEFYKRRTERHAATNLVEGVLISFRMPGDLEDRLLYYFAADVSDAGLTRTPAYLQWVANAGPQATFLKAASYLMHKPYFSQIRSFLLERSKLLVQDDSGIPFRFFTDKQWERRMYGAYLGPIPLFSDWYQEDMKQAYAREARPLDFGIGYRSARGTSNLQMMARR